MNTETRDQYESALDAAISELESVTAKLRVQQRKTKSMQLRINELHQLIAASSKLVSDSKRAEIKNRLGGMESVATIRPDTGSPEYRQVINLLSANPDRPWRVEHLRRQLMNLGIDASPKSLYNTVQRLHQKGLLVKVRRGLYQVNDLNLALIRQEDFDDGE